MDMREVAIGSKVRLRDGSEGILRCSKTFSGIGGGESSVYDITVGGRTVRVWEDGGFHKGCGGSESDVIGVVGSEDKREGEEYLERLNELSTENIVLGRVIDVVLRRVSGGSCAVVLGERCSGCMLVDGGERVKCLRGRLEGMEKVGMREEVSCG